MNEFFFLQQNADELFPHMLVKRQTEVNMQLKEAGYPTLEEVTPDCSALRLISPAYAGKAGELTAILQYVFQSIVLEECGFIEIAKTLVRLAVSETRHLQLLGTAICKLGAPPVFTACPPYPVGYYSASNVDHCKNPRQMICADICAEENAIADYERMLCRLSNPPISALISRIAEEKRENLRVLNQILRDLG